MKRFVYENESEGNTFLVIEAKDPITAVKYLKEYCGRDEGDKETQSFFNQWELEDSYVKDTKLPVLHIST